MRGLISLGLLAMLAGACRRADERAAVLGGVPAAGPEIVDDTFEQLYPMFLLRKIGDAQKAALWTRYDHRWVRWTGKLISFTENGATFKHIPGTTTFDVSLVVEPSARSRLHKFKLGDQVTYVGQLHKFDGIFRTFYLVHGDVAGP